MAAGDHNTEGVLNRAGEMVPFNGKMGSCRRKGPKAFERKWMVNTQRRWKADGVVERVGERTQEAGGDPWFRYCKLPTFTAAEDKYEWKETLPQCHNFFRKDGRGNGGALRAGASHSHKEWKGLWNEPGRRQACWFQSGSLQPSTPPLSRDEKGGTEESSLVEADSERQKGTSWP